MKSTYKSPFNPKNFKDFKPKKIKIHTFNSGFKLVNEKNIKGNMFRVIMILEIFFKYFIKKIELSNK